MEFEDFDIDDADKIETENECGYTENARSTANQNTVYEGAIRPYMFEPIGESPNSQPQPNEDTSQEQRNDVQPTECYVLFLIPNSK